MNPHATAGTRRYKRSPPTESETSPTLRSPPIESKTAPTLKKDDLPSPVCQQDSSTQDVADVSANDDETADPVDLSVCTSVVYEERNSVPGVRFVNSKGQEEWLPVVKKSGKEGGRN